MEGTVNAAGTLASSRIELLRGYLGQLESMLQENTQKIASVLDRLTGECYADSVLEEENKPTGTLGSLEIMQRDVDRAINKLDGQVKRLVDLNL